MYFCSLEGHVGKFPKASSLDSPQRSGQMSLCRCFSCLIPSRWLDVEPPLWLLWLPNPFYRATTDWRVVLIRGEGLGGKRRSDEEEMGVEGGGWLAITYRVIQTPEAAAESVT